MTIYKNFGDSIRHLRNSWNLSIKELAIQIGTVESHLGNIERGAQAPTIKVAVALANFFRVGIDECMDGLHADADMKNKELINIVNSSDDKFDLELIHTVVTQAKMYTYRVKNDR